MNKVGKCLLAGLPGSGKTTYMAALSYMLEHHVENQELVLGAKVVDKSALNRISRPWMEMKEVDRTIRGIINSTDFDLVKRNAPNEHIKFDLRDIAGENYFSLLSGSQTGINPIDGNVSSLLFFVRDFPSHVLIEDIPSSQQKPSEGVQVETTQPVEFSTQSVSVDVLNVLLLKRLKDVCGFNKICVVLSCWDSRNEEEIPEEILKNDAPFLYNYIRFHYPKCRIFGLSAQGAEYTNDKGQQDELLEKTRNGTRSYVVLDSNKSYDISLPLTYLI